MQRLTYDLARPRRLFAKGSTLPTGFSKPGLVPPDRKCASYGGRQAPRVSVVCRIPAHAVENQTLFL